MRARTHVRTRPNVFKQRHLMPGVITDCNVDCLENARVEFGIIRRNQLKNDEDKMAVISILVELNFKGPTLQ